jgi:uncharacterized repeat protein (TIGR03803 family)
MKNLLHPSFTPLVALLALLLGTAALGNTPATAPPLEESLVYSFTNTGDGAYPGGGMILGSDGNFYGTTCGTAFGAGGPGASSYGSVFKLTPGGILSTIYTFTGGSDGNCPAWELAEGPDGNFYGVTTGGNATTPYGTIFKLTPGGSLTVLYAFCGTVNCVVDVGPKSPGFLGQQPALTLGNDGNFYGTFQGGTCGQIVQMTPAGALSVVHSFNCTSDGGTPEPGLLLGSDGNFYGVAKTSTDSTGSTEVGELYKVTPGGALSVLYEFCSSAGCSSDYGQPVGAPVRGADGNLYGVANFVSGTGVVYEVTASGAVTILASISSSSFDWTMRLAGTDGSIYGGGGNYVFRYTPGAGIYYWSAAGNSNQYGAPTALVQDAAGTFFGQSSEGGNDEIGSIFTASLLGPGVTLSASPVTLTLGQAATLTWSSTGETTCAASGAWSGAKATSGALAVTPTALGANSFTLTCNGPNGSATTAATVTAVAPAPTATISATPGTITLGQSVTVDWSSTNATSCTSSGAWSGSRSASGMVSFTPSSSGTATFTVACSGAGGVSAPASARVQVNAAPTPTATISATPGTITLGQSVTLDWSSTNATSCTSSGAWNGSRSASGTASFTPSSSGTATFTVACSGAGGVSAPASARVQVNPASGHGGGGGLGMGTLLGLGMLLAQRVFRSMRRGSGIRCRRSTA